MTLLKKFIKINVIFNNDELAKIDIIFNDNELTKVPATITKVFTITIL